MGQRHQVYVIYNEDDTDKVMAFHAQWSYGTLPVRALSRALTYLTKTEKMYWHEGDKIIECVLSVDVPTGVFNRHTEITKEVTEVTPLRNGKVNPDLGDNNDGITIIDARNLKDVKYGFTFLDNRDMNMVTPYIIMDAEQYMKCYYKEFNKTPAQNMGAILRKVMKRNLITKDDLSIFASSFKNKFN